METKFGVHLEVGQLRKVMVCAPGRAHQRLTPSDCDDLLFGDVLGGNTKRDHFAPANVFPLSSSVPSKARA